MDDGEAAMTMQDFAVAEATEVASTVSKPDTPPRAYMAEEYLDVPDAPTASGRVRWALSLAALIGAAAALVVAGAHGAHVMATPKVATVTTTVTAPAAPAPDRNAAFLADLKMAGVPVTNSSNAISNAYVLCAVGDDSERSATGDLLLLPMADPGGRSDAERERALQRYLEIVRAHFCPGGQL